MQAVRRWMLIFGLAAITFGPGPNKPITVHSAAAAQSTPPIGMTSPTACPSTGCVAGQRLGMRFDFGFPASLVDPSSLQPPGYNMRICFYAATYWGIKPDTLSIDSNGRLPPSIAYIDPKLATPLCNQDKNQPQGYTLMAERVAAVPVGTSADGLQFTFRLGDINGPVTGDGAVLARLFPLTAPGIWAADPSLTATSPAIHAVPLAGATSVYVAENGGTCDNNKNCFINSDGDGADGLGTGLKDAIDVLPASATINILGNYPVKGHTVLVDKKLTITGSNGATITSSDTADAGLCANPMLSLKATVIVRGLYFNGGDCTNKRNLIDINSTTPKPAAGDYIFIESNDFSGGANAITIQGSTTDVVIVRYNYIYKNAGFGVYAKNGPAVLEVVANDFLNNGSTIQCADGAAAPVSNRRANHNYWDSGSPDPNATHCIIDSAKRLGSPVAQNTDAAGIRAALVRVTNQKTSAAQFGNLISYKYTGSGSPFNLYIVDYGYMPLITYNGQEAYDAPFSFWGGGANPSPCSNYWDVFLSDGAPANTTLELYFKYFNNGLASKCVDTINLAQYCSQATAPEKYPLFWLDPSSKSITDWWDPVGATPTNLTTVNGQVTTCHTDTQEIQVSLSSKNRPALSDLGFTPFVVGIPVIKSFSLQTSSQTVTINWATNIEADVYNFSILRGTSSSNLSSVSNLTNLPRYGSSTSGYTYSKSDTGLTNGTVYYYRLKVIRADGNAIYSDMQHITVNVATPIPPTPTLTRTPIRPTSTPPFTPVPTSLPTQPFKSPTPQPTFTAAPTQFSLPTLTDTAEPQVIGAAATLTAVAIASVPSITPSQPAEATVSATPEDTSAATLPEVIAGTSTPGRHPWLSLLLGLLAGLVLVIGVGWWYRINHK